MTVISEAKALNIPVSDEIDTKSLSIVEQYADLAAAL